jgi:hypothetical protein
MLQKIEVTEFLDSIKRSHPEFLESLKSEFLRTLKKRGQIVSIRIRCRYNSVHTEPNQSETILEIERAIK